MDALITSLLASTVTMATPLLLAALGEVLVERAGVLDIGLEGKILAGAFAGMVVTWATGWPLAGVLAAALTGVGLAAISAFLVIVRLANQVVVGTAVNILALGATGVAYRAVFGITGAALSIPPLPRWDVPVLVDLPLVGRPFFSQTWLGFLTFALVPALAWFLYSSLPGLRLRACGEDPLAAEAQGIRVRALRVRAILLSGALAGLAGAYLSVSYSQTFVEGMSAGRGFIALAIVVFGRWSPYGALAGALLFGFATALQFHFQALGLPVPYQFFLSLPYLLTLLVLAGFAGHRQPPAALGLVYERG
jgi:simple sugar transport system permease protein